MMRNCWLMAAGALLVLVPNAQAMDFSVDAYADARLVLPAGGEKSWIDGGLGKFRFGAAQPSPNFRLVEAVAQGTLAVTDELHAVGVIRLEPEQRSGLDILESYASWRPGAEGGWQWSAKAGVFFPPISVENDDLGWTSPYTLTPSAINSWVGEELRTIGGEGTVAFSRDWGTLTAVGAFFCCNEPAGDIMADRGWALDDRSSGLLERVREPDTTAALFGETPPSRAGLFQNIDGHVGWYAGGRVELSGVGQLAALRYDNEADPDAATSGDAAWHTRFWSVSLTSRLAGVAILAQGLAGDTAIGGYYGPDIVTDFRSAFLLLSYDIDEEWRVSGRADLFQTRNSSGTLFDEDGRALTGALIWNARDWLRLSAEILNIDSRRGERVLEGGTAARNDTQFQLGARVFL